MKILTVRSHTVDRQLVASCIFASYVTKKVQMLRLMIMNKVFKTKQRNRFCIPNKTFLIERKNGVTVNVTRIDVFECNECEDERWRCYCLAA